MTKLNITIIILYFIMGITYSQEQEKEQYVYKNQQSIYYELHGISGALFSVHYDRIIKTSKKSYFNISAGIGYGNAQKDITFVSLPISINHTFGLKNHHFEYGFATVYRYIGYDEIKRHNIFLGPKITYKFQEKNKLFIKVSLNPMLAIVSFNDDTNCGLFGCDNFYMSLV